MTPPDTAELANATATLPSVELPFDVFCDAPHFVQAAGADGLADTLVECAAESGYVAVDIAREHMTRQLEGWADDAD